jgi:dihydroneopterin aldolase
MGGMDEIAISLEGISAPCILGVYPEERLAPREVLVDLTLLVERPRDAADDLATTLDYGGLETLVRATAAQGSFFLVESLAEAIAAKCLRFVKVREATVTVEKTAVLPRTKAVRVTVCRRRPPGT